jgi:hypothetical protein
MTCSRRAIAVTGLRASGNLTATALRLFGGLSLGTCLLAAAPTASAQPAPHPTPADGSIAAVPPGSARIGGRIVDPDQPDTTGGLEVVLYSLSADGAPGLARSQTGPDGRFSFSGVSGEPDILYLVGARYHDVPYGERLRFAPGEHEINVELSVSKPSTRGDAITVADMEIRIEWLGTRLAIQEQYRLVNPGTKPVFVPKSARAGATPPFEARLPPRAENLQTALFNGADSFDREDDKLVYWGPIYPGEQEIRYGYLVPATSGANPLVLNARLPNGAKRLRVMAPETGPEISSLAMRTAQTVELEGQSFAVLEAESLRAGTSVEIAIRVPETTRDLEQLRLDGSELTMELDDTVLEVTQRHQLVLKPGAHLAGSPTDPLLRFELPQGASLTGLAGGADRLGVRATDTSIDVFGPLGPGVHELAFRYRVPAQVGATQLELRFPIEVPTLTLLVADTGLLLESERLHRLRPRQLGTRTWLVREAFQIAPDEAVSIRFDALSRSAVPPVVSLLLVLGAGALVMVFVVTPLRGGHADPSDPQHHAGIRRERELVYEMIRDLDHDFETGKLAAHDHERRRAELRARAIELLREEREERAEPAPETCAETRPADASGTTPALERDGYTRCRSCGGPIGPGWNFCPGCGDGLKAPPARRRERPR